MVEADLMGNGRNLSNAATSPALPKCAGHMLRRVSLGSPDTSAEVMRNVEAQEGFGLARMCMRCCCRLAVYRELRTAKSTEALNLSGGMITSMGLKRAAAFWYENVERHKGSNLSRM